MPPRDLAAAVSARVEAATSPQLLESDWGLNFELVDLVSADVDASREVVRALRARLSHANPKIVLLALAVSGAKGPAPGSCAAAPRRGGQRFL